MFDQAYACGLIRVKNMLLPCEYYELLWAAFVIKCWRNRTGQSTDIVIGKGDVFFDAPAEIEEPKKTSKYFYGTQNSVSLPSSLYTS